MQPDKMNNYIERNSKKALEECSAENERLREKLDDAIEFLKETHRDPAKYDLCFDKRDIEELESK